MQTSKTTVAADVDVAAAAVLLLQQLVVVVFFIVKQFEYWQTQRMHFYH